MHVTPRSSAAAATTNRSDPRSAERAFGSSPHAVAGAAGARHAAAAGAVLPASRHASLEGLAGVSRQTLVPALNNELVPSMGSTDATHEDRVSIEKHLVKNGRATCAELAPCAQKWSTGSASRCPLPPTRFEPRALRTQFILHHHHPTATPGLARRLSCRPLFSLRRPSCSRSMQSPYAVARPST